MSIDLDKKKYSVLMPKYSVECKTQVINAKAMGSLRFSLFSEAWQRLSHIQLFFERHR